ncbi:MAG: hypothetical protein P8X90_31525 [Desulfobacterales bacterium]
MKNDGRSGTITYQSGSNKIEIDWELSGSPEYDFLLAPVDLREWSEPKGAKIPFQMQIQILQKLRSWVKDQKLKTDIDSPVLDVEDNKCIRSTCSRKRLSGFVYCSVHYDENLLKK